MACSGVSVLVLSGEEEDGGVCDGVCEGVCEGGASEGEGVGGCGSTALPTRGAKELLLRRNELCVKDMGCVNRAAFGIEVRLR